MKQRRKPDRWWQSREIGGGFPQIGGLAKAALLGALVEGRRSEPGKPFALTGGRGKRFWFLEKRPVIRKASGRDMGRQRSFANSESCRQRWARGGAALLGGTRVARVDRCVCAPCARRPKLEARRQARAQPGPDCREVVRCRSEEPDLGRGSIQRSLQRELRTRKSSGSRVLVSSVGCRGRLEGS
jgi:hypothetical protein